MVVVVANAARDREANWIDYRRSERNGVVNSIVSATYLALDTERTIRQCDVAELVSAARNDEARSGSAGSTVDENLRTAETTHRHIGFRPGNRTITARVDEDFVTRVGVGEGLIDSVGRVETSNVLPTRSIRDGPSCVRSNRL